MNSTFIILAIGLITIWTIFAVASLIITFADMTEE